MSTCITEFEHEPSMLSIGVLGYNSEMSIYGFKQIISNNLEDVIAVNSIANEAMLAGGTMLKAIVGNVENSTRGRRFDQLVLFDDDRWDIIYHRGEDIRHIQDFTMHLTNVPEDFQILLYEDIREE